MATGSWRRRVAERVFLTAEGAPRRLLWRLAFGRDGQLVRPFRRIFFRSNGAARADLGSQLAAMLEAPHLAVWLDRHDAAPGPDDLPPGLPLLPLAVPIPDDSALDPRLSAVLAAEEPQILRSADRPLRPGPIALLLPGAIPRPGALARLAAALAEEPDADLIYGDDVTEGPMGLPVSPWFKPRHSPELARAGGFFGRLVALSASAASRLDTALPPDDALDRLAASLPEAAIRHLPRVLSVNLRPGPPRRSCPVPDLPDLLPVVTIVIPTRDRWSLLRPCLAALETTDWPRARLDIIVVDNGSTDGETLAGLSQAMATGHLRVLRDDGPFNFARLNNRAVGLARGSLLVFLNNDTVALTPSWLRILAAWALQPGIGAVGPKLLYPDGRVQHGGMILGIGGRADHAHIGLAADAPGYQGLANVVHEVSAVTGACLAVRHAAFDAVGGFNEDFAVAFNDVVLCADLLAAGYRNLYLPDALFLHHESPSRGRTRSAAEAEREAAEARAARLLHPALFAEDPYYSPALSDRAPHVLASEPRDRRLR